jgi:hypothetical protein
MDKTKVYFFGGVLHKEVLHLNLTTNTYRVPIVGGYLHDHISPLTYEEYTLVHFSTGTVNFAVMVLNTVDVMDFVDYIEDRVWQINV